eukprot:gene13020-17452_t
MLIASANLVSINRSTRVFNRLVNFNLDRFQLFCESKISRHEFSGYKFVSGANEPKDNNRSLIFSTNGCIMGHLSESSVLTRSGGTVVHATINSSFNADPKDSSLPLTVDYRARHYAFGLIPKVAKRRERHGGDDEILVARIIDRAIRPLFPKGYVNEIQLTVTAHAADGLNDPTVVAVNGASFALMKSRQPWNGPIGCVRIGLIDGELVVNPTLAEMKSSSMDFLYAGSAERTLMIETVGKEIPDETIKSAIRLAHEEVKTIISMQTEQLAQENINVNTPNGDAMVESTDKNDVLSVEVTKRFPFIIPDQLKKSLFQRGWNEAIKVYTSGGEKKDDRSNSEGKLRAELISYVSQEFPTQHVVVRGMAVDYLLNCAFRQTVLSKTRVDGRSFMQLRKISCAADVLPVVHGSSYFARGDTHVLSTVTLGPKTDSRMTISIDGTKEQINSNFYLHYDFPPYCTGETGNATGTNRRMIGHGNLAERALRYVMPSIDEFPYAVRVYSECTVSNGSSSMASVCGASIALMDAGVPIKAPVAGLSIGLVLDESQVLKYVDSLDIPKLPTDQQLANQNEDKKDSTVRKHNGYDYVLLKDILGTEDHHGDMDFKVAGSRKGITSIQLDTKLQGGIPTEIICEAIDIATQGRLSILQSIKSDALSVPRVNVKTCAPKAFIVNYDVERIGKLIGERGEMIKYIEEFYECEIDLHEVGVAYIYGMDRHKVAEARQLVQDLAVTLNVGDVHFGQIINIMDFGVVVQLNRGQEAMLHVSDMSHDVELMKKPIAELFKIGQIFEVKVTHVNNAIGMVRVSRKELLDPVSSVPDSLTSYIPPTDSDLSSSPSFPIIPPKPYHRRFFENNVVSPADIEKAMKENNNNNSKTLNNQLKKKLK